MSPTSNIKPLTSKAIRVGFDAKRAFNNGTGLGNYSRFVISGLIRQFPEHEYFLFTPEIKTEYSAFYTQSPNVKLITPDSFLGKQFSSFWRTYAIADMCTELALDVFHGLSNELPVGIDTFSGKKIVTIHDLIFLRYPAYYNNIDRFIYTKKFRRACEQADLVLAASLQTQRDIEHYFGTPSDKIRIGYQNCDERFSDIKSEEERYFVRNLYSLPKQFILCVGTIEHRKNQLTVLKAFHRLNDPDHLLVFIGKQTDYASELKAYIEKNGLSTRVQFLQHIPSEHLPTIYQLSRVFVYASEFEGFGIPVLEGMRSNIPVIAANASSLPEVGGNAIAYFEPNDIEELTARLRDALIKLPSPGRYDAQLDRFDSKKLIIQLESFYR